MMQSAKNSDQFRHIAVSSANRVIRQRRFAALLIWPLLVACGSSSSSGASTMAGMAGTKGSDSSGGLNGASGISDAAGSTATGGFGGATSAGADAGGSHTGNANAGTTRKKRRKKKRVPCANARQAPMRASLFTIIKRAHSIHAKASVKNTSARRAASTVK